METVLEVLKVDLDECWNDSESTGFEKVSNLVHFIENEVFSIETSDLNEIPTSTYHMISLILALCFLSLAAESHFVAEIKRPRRSWIILPASIIGELFSIDLLLQVVKRGSAS